MAPVPDIQAAERFMLSSARLLDRLRFAYHFQDGPAEAVVDALRPYQNPDGGFGHALEPDGRGAGSQPAHVHHALQVLDDVGRLGGPIVQRAVDYLVSVTTDRGGVPVALPTLNEAPRAPWWNVDGDAPPASLLPTAGIVGLLLANRFEHPWLDRATAFCWEAIEALQETHPYEINFCVTFLDRAPDRARAERLAGRLGELVRDRHLVLLDPDVPGDVTIPPGYAPGERQTPIDYATSPDSLARRWFSEREVERALETLTSAQEPDGGWRFNWREWNPATTLEWRGAVTVRALTILRNYGRIR
jgi:hypothetical protein